VVAITDGGIQFRQIITIGPDLIRSRSNHPTNIFYSYRISH
jgi:hypothetical protein